MNEENENKFNLGRFVPKTWPMQTALSVSALFFAWHTVVATGQYESKVIVAGGKVRSVAAPGFGVKIPLIQSAYTRRTDMQEIVLDKASVTIQNGTITAENLESSIFIKFNGTREQKDVTTKVIFEKMHDFEGRVKALASKALRDVARTTVVASSETDEKSEVQKATKEKPNFLDSKNVGVLAAKSLQISIDLVLGKVDIGSEGKPEMKSRVEVTNFALGAFKWDDKYEVRRNDIQGARAKSEQARFEKSEKERKADGVRAEARG